jgi:protein SCO1/2
MRDRRKSAIVLVAALALSAGTPVVFADTPSESDYRLKRFDQADALRASQAVVGGGMRAHVLVDTEGKSVDLADYRGKPLVVSLIYTSCYHSCNVLTRYLGEVIEIAREALGESSFSVATIGFDTANDTPGRMAMFAARHGINVPGWSFLSGDADTVRALTGELGFTYVASPQGFDHLTQVTVLDGEGRIYRQIYGDRFNPPALVEPLKELVFGLDPSPATLVRWVDNVRLFCTIYDPSTGRYRFDYSIFIALIIGVLCLGAIATFIVRAWRENTLPPAH